MPVWLPHHPVLLVLTWFVRIYRFSIGLELLISVATLIISLFYCWRRMQPGYLNWFPAYFFISLLSDLFSTHWHSKGSIIFWIFTIFETLFFGYFFHRVFHDKKRKTLVLGLVTAFLILASIVSFTMPVLPGLRVATLLQSIVLVIPCACYYFDMMSQFQIIGISKNPSFFIVNGLFFYFLIQFPVVLFEVFYTYTHEPPLASFVYSMNNFSQFISYVLFIKAMTCLARPT